MYVIKIELTNGTINSVNDDFKLTSIENGYMYTSYMLAKKAVNVLKQRITGDIVIIENN
jgi:hypothetical protein